MRSHDLPPPKGQVVLLYPGGGKLDNPQQPSTQIGLNDAQIGDFTAGDIAGSDITKVISHVYNVTTSLEQVTTILREDIQLIEARINTLETVERQHTSERSALTRLITMLATESKTVSDIQDLLAHQIEGDKDERVQRRHYLDTMLTSLVVLSFINLGFHIYRVIRRTYRTA
jgi:hypothetical protein